MASRAHYVGRENILAGFETLSKGSPYFSFWYSAKNMGCCWDGDEDFEGAKAFLDEILHAAEQNGNDDLLVIRFHKKSDAIKGITDRTPTTGMMYVRVHPQGTIQPSNTINGVNVNGNTQQMYTRDQWEKLSVLENLPATIGNIIDAKIAAITPPPVEPDLSVFEKILGMFPEEVIAGVTNRLLDYVLPAKRTEFEALPQRRVAGVETENKEPMAKEKTVDQVQDTDQQNSNPEEIDMTMLNDALGRLSQHCQIDEDLKRLADLAEKNPMLFKGVLNTLRSM